MGTQYHEGGERMYRIGIDLGGTNIAAGLVDDGMRILDVVSVKTNAPRPVEDLLEDMAELVSRLTERNGLTPDYIASVGVGVPCTANPDNGHLEDADNLGYADTPFLTLLQAKLPVPVYFENDANAAAWGEYLTGGYAEDSFLMVTIGTGIGGGIILGGKLWHGINGAAAEFGHMTLSLDGVPCNCGRRGCFEALASATALIRQAREAMSANPESLLWQLCGGDTGRIEAKTVFDGAAAGDPTALGLLDRYTTFLAEGIANLINIFQPAILCIGGGVSRAGDALLLPLREKTAQRIYSRNSRRNTHICLAKLDNNAGILGAALLGAGKRSVT